MNTLSSGIVIVAAFIVVAVVVGAIIKRYWVSTLACILTAATTASKTASSTGGVRLVVSRFAENVDFLHDTPPFNRFRNVTIYNKGAPLTDIKARYANIVDLPNIGRCDHTALHHIIENYDNLDDVTVFLPASLMSHSYKRLHATYLLTRKMDGNSHFVDYGFLMSQPIRKRFRNLVTSGTYKCIDPANAAANTDTRLQPATPPAFIDWMDTHLPGRNSQTASWYFIFMVSKRDILSNPRSFYQRLIKQLEVGPNPAAGHYFERAWPAIFNINPI